MGISVPDLKLLGAWLTRPAAVGGVLLRSLNVSCDETEAEQAEALSVIRSAGVRIECGADLL